MSDDSVPEIFLSANRFGIRLGLSRMRTLMKMLGNPHKKLSYIHVAGTNGKGSVVSLIAAALAASGQKVGIYTSPYLERFSERIRVLDGIEGLSEYQRNDAYGEIPPEALRDIGDLIEKRYGMPEGSEHPTELNWSPPRPIFFGNKDAIASFSRPGSEVDWIRRISFKTFMLGHYGDRL